MGSTPSKSFGAFLAACHVAKTRSAIAASPRDSRHLSTKVSRDTRRTSYEILISLRFTSFHFHEFTKEIETFTLTLDGLLHKELPKGSAKSCTKTQNSPLSDPSFHQTQRVFEEILIHTTGWTYHVTRHVIRGIT
jgi:hypothetical protein